MTTTEMTTTEEKLASVTAEEQELRFEQFTYDDALQVGGTIVDRARERGQAVAVSIMFGRQRIFHAALAGTRIENQLWLERKIRTVESYGQSSYRVGLSFRQRGADFRASSWHDPHDYAAFGGAFPIRIGEVLAGVVAVSGLPEDADHALVVEGLRAVR